MIKKTPIIEVDGTRRGTPITTTCGICGEQMEMRWSQLEDKNYYICPSCHAVKWTMLS